MEYLRNVEIKYRKFLFVLRKKNIINNPIEKPT